MIFESLLGVLTKNPGTLKLNFTIIGLLFEHQFTQICPLKTLNYLYSLT